MRSGDNEADFCEWATMGLSDLDLAFCEGVLNVSDEATRARFLECVDSSGYSLADWIAALRYFQEWLAEHGLCLSLFEQLGYLHCAAEAAGVGTTGMEALQSLLESFLAEYGCERASVLHNRAN